MRRIVKAECGAASVEAAPYIEHIGSFLPLINEASATERTVTALQNALGTERVLHTPPPVTISEDFGLLAAAAVVSWFFWFIRPTDPAQYAEAWANKEVDRQVPANHSSRFAPVPVTLISAGIEALVVASSAWATLVNS